MFKVYKRLFNKHKFDTVQEALDDAIKQSGENVGETFIVIEEVATVTSQRVLAPIETKVTSLRDGFRV